MPDETTTPTERLADLTAVNLDLLARDLERGVLTIQQAGAVALIRRAAQLLRARLRESERLRAECTAAWAVNERDRTAYAGAAHSLEAWMRRWSGIAASRGAYEWDDDAYRREFGRAIEEMGKITDRFARRSHMTDRAHCPTTQAAVDAARAVPSLSAPGRDGDAAGLSARDAARRPAPEVPDGCV